MRRLIGKVLLWFVWPQIERGYWKHGLDELNELSEAIHAAELRLKILRDLQAHRAGRPTSL